MRKHFGRACLVLGALCIFAAAGLFVYNRLAEQRAAESTGEALSAVSESIASRKAELAAEARASAPDAAVVPVSGHDPDAGTVVEGERYLGILLFPTLGQEMPVLADWDYAALMRAPARYYGSIASGDLVLAAHNFPAHFGALFLLSVGDAVRLTDANGDVHRYTVAKIEELLPAQKSEMLSGEWALTLFSCNYAASHRYTVRCTEDK